MKTRKSNSYFRIILIMLAGAIVGGVFGIGMYILTGHYGQGIGRAAAQTYIISQTLCIVFLSLGYSSNYLSSSDAARGNFLYACIIFIICMLYDSFWQVRYIKLIQKAYPERKGDPASKKFQEQWLESCDEAEREVIYRSAYRTYITLGKLIRVLLLVTMLSNLFFNTGMLAVFIVAVIWLVSTLSYTRSCVALKEEKALVK